MIGIGGVTSTSSAMEAPSKPKAEFGAESLLVLTVVQGFPVPVTVEVHPAGRAGAVTPSNASLNPHTAGPVHLSFVVQALPSSQVL
jgi:hypothetical protein